MPYDVVIQTLRTEEREPEKPAEKTNFRITDDALGHGGPKAKFRMNMDAIRTLQTIEFEQRLATPEEQEVLSRYVGWGSLPQVFEENNAAWADELPDSTNLVARGIPNCESFRAKRALYKPHGHQGHVYGD